jgi:glycosyltransferase involved in cell wall biosynthesis
MKLIIQIPCYNEEKTLPITLRDFPRQIPGVECIEYLIVDDGSSDRTVEVARELGVHHIVRLGKHLGLGAAFRAGLEACLKRGADLIVNTDGDNQYSGADIPLLIQPLLDQRADLVIGVRDIDSVHDFSPLKKKLQKIGSWVVCRAARCRIEDTTSGFRAFNREAALRLNIFSEFSYTLETLIQAGQSALRVITVPISVNRKLRESRLAGSIPQYVGRSAATILRIYATYYPLRFFSIGGGFFFLAGLILSLRYLMLYVFYAEGGHLQSLILASILFMLGVQLWVIGLVSELICVNRRLAEDVLYRFRKLEMETKQIAPWSENSSSPASAEPTSTSAFRDSQ